MKLVSDRSFWVLCILLAPIASACTTTKRLHQVESERDTLAQEKTSLETRVESLQSRLEQANAQAQAQGARMQQTEANYESLVGALGAVVAEQDIAIEQMKYGVRLEIPQDVLFATGSAQLGESGREVLVEVAEKLVDVPYQVVVAGHSDNVPIGPSLRARFSSNWELAAARAAEVTEFLQSQGVPPTRLIAVSFGEYRPIASNDTTEGRAENRRIELLLRPFTQQDYFSAP
jgi:chemotaxis protein MotB